MSRALGSLRRTTRNSAIARRLSTSSWTFATTSKLVCEPGGTSRLGEILQSLGGSRVMLVTDGGVYGAGLCDAAIDSLAAAGLFTVLHGETVAAPPARHRERVAAVQVAVREAAMHEGQRLR